MRTGTASSTCQSMVFRDCASFTRSSEPEYVYSPAGDPPNQSQDSTRLRSDPVTVMSSARAGAGGLCALIRAGSRVAESSAAQMTAIDLRYTVILRCPLQWTIRRADRSAVTVRRHAPAQPLVRRYLESCR